jgi:uncharacterized protein (DUF1778 family)
VIAALDDPANKDFDQFAEVQTAAKLEGAGSRTGPVVDGAGRAALQLISDAVLETALNQ